MYAILEVLPSSRLLRHRVGRGGAAPVLPLEHLAFSYEQAALFARLWTACFGGSPTDFFLPSRHRTRFLILDHPVTSVSLKHNCA